MIKKLSLPCFAFLILVSIIAVSQKTASAIEFDILINDSVDIDGFIWNNDLAEQGVDYANGLFYTSSGSPLQLFGSISVFDENWQRLQCTGEGAYGHNGDITVYDGRVYSPVCPSSTDCVVREYYLSSEGLLTGSTNEHDISIMGFQLAGLDYYENHIYGIEYTESGTASIVKFDLNLLYIEKYEILINYANGIEIVDFGPAGAYVFITWGDINPVGNISIYSLGNLSVDMINPRLSSHEFETNFTPGHAEGLTISGNQIWLAQGETILMGTISITHTLTATAASNGSISPDGETFVERDSSKIFNATPDIGYEVDQWSIGTSIGTSVVQNGGNSYTVSNIQEDMNVSVTFEAIADEETNIVATEDSTLSENVPTTKYGSTPILVVQSGTTDYYGVVKFDLSDIPNGSTITDVDLRLYCSSSSGALKQVLVVECDSEWEEADVTWDTQPSFGGDCSFRHTVNSTGYQYIYDSELTNIVNRWVNGIENNNGLYLLPGNVDDTFQFSSSEDSNSSYRPLLIVGYTPPPLPDLIVSRLQPTPEPVNNTYYVGDSVSWEVTIKNNGEGPASSSEVGYYLGDSLDDLSTPLTDSTDGIDALDSGESDTETSVYVFDSSDIGQKYLICIADNDDEIDESEEENNKWVYGPFTIAQPTVATPSSITIPSSDSDGSYTVSWGSSSTSSVTYVLEEATNSSFTSGSRIAYSGTLISANITGRSSDSTYYYRVKATSSGYNDSLWQTGSNGCTVTIPEENPELSVIPDSRTVNSNQGTTTFTVNNISNGTMPWTASVVSGEDWLSITSGSSGTDSGSITAVFSANTSNSSRTGTIRVTASWAVGSPKDVTVIQPTLSTDRIAIINPDNHRILKHGFKRPWLGGSYDDPTAYTYFSVANAEIADGCSYFDNPDCWSGLGQQSDFIGSIMESAGYQVDYYESTEMPVINNFDYKLVIVQDPLRTNLMQFNAQQSESTEPDLLEYVNDTTFLNRLDSYINSGGKVILVGDSVKLLETFYEKSVSGHNVSRQVDQESFIIPDKWLFIRGNSFCGIDRIGAATSTVESSSIITVGSDFATLTLENLNDLPNTETWSETIYYPTDGTALLEVRFVGSSEYVLSGSTCSPTQYNATVNEVIPHMMGYTSHNGNRIYYIGSDAYFDFQYKNHDGAWHAGQFAEISYTMSDAAKDAAIELVKLAIYSDQDGDGILDLDEDNFCSDTNDADTDDDGILDGIEDANKNGVVDNGETNPCNPDSDGDGIQDGTELGYTLADVGPDTNINVFIPDEDDSTTTNPLLEDTDSDGVDDGQEDKNYNGRVDEGESDPDDINSKPSVNSIPAINLLLLPD